MASFSCWQTAFPEQMAAKAIAKGTGFCLERLPRDQCSPCHANDALLLQYSKDHQNSRDPESKNKQDPLALRGRAAWRDHTYKMWLNTKQGNVRTLMAIYCCEVRNAGQMGGCFSFQPLLTLYLTKQPACLCLGGRRGRVCLCLLNMAF